MYVNPYTVSSSSGKGGWYFSPLHCRPFAAQHTNTYTHTSAHARARRPTGRQPRNLIWPIDVDGIAQAVGLHGSDRFPCSPCLLEPQPLETTYAAAVPRRTRSGVVPRLPGSRKRKPSCSTARPIRTEQTPWSSAGPPPRALRCTHLVWTYMPYLPVRCRTLPACRVRICL
jgi:hypothetical protein